MKRFILSTIFVFAITLISAQTSSNMEGVFISKENNRHLIWLFVDGYSSQTIYTEDSYISTFGGPYTYQNGILTIKMEYNDVDKNAVGQSVAFALKAVPTGFVDSSGQTWKKEISKAQELDGLWKITDRKQDDKMVKIHQTGTRKTIKLLFDGYFQWVAMDPKAKTFSGTGGGKYSFVNNKYEEYMLFFSRDNSRIGNRLIFDGELKQGAWHHSGLSSKGDAIYEIWRKENR